MESKKPAKKRSTSEVSSENNFYETMPMSMGSHYVYRDDVAEQYRGADDRLDEAYEATVRRVAIITLIVAAAVAIGIGILFAQGLSVFHDAMPVNSTSSGSLEL